MHLAPLIIDLAIILVVAAIMSFIFQKLKQPVVLGYIITGLVIGPHTPPFQLVKDLPSIQTLADLGVIFLMFSLGLEFSFRKLLSVGVTAGVSAGLEVFFFLVVGFGVGKALGWNDMDSLFLGAMLSISSTTIIIKALDELKLKTHRFANLIFGILIVEDLFAILLLVALTTVAQTQTFSFIALGSATINLVLVVGSWFITGYFVIPRVMNLLSKKEDNEILTISCIGLCLFLVVVAVHFGYSAALGAFIMGSILAETKVIGQIETLMVPLKDLFGAIFFVSIGMLIDPKVIWEYKGTILLLCVITIVGKIFINSLGALISGQSFRNSVQVGFGLAQIGEFSFIIAGLGSTLKATSPKLYPIGVAVSLVTTFTTPYLIKHSAHLAEEIEKRLPHRLRLALDRYIVWCEHKRGGNHKHRAIFFLFARWIANGTIVTLIFNASLRNFSDKVMSVELIWLFAFAASSPFIWGMVFTSKKTYLRIRKDRDLVRATLVLVFPILTSIWIALLSTNYFSLNIVLPMILIFITIIYFSLFKRLESYYRWLEKTFLSSFEETNHEDENPFSQLAPWDSHLIRIEVHPNAILVNKTLMGANLRQRFGVNIVAIQRGINTTIAPLPTEVILPRDTLIMLGTDEQLDMARPEIEIPENIASNLPLQGQYRLRHLKVTATSPLAGRTIRQSGIRENFQALVVGMEKAQKRIINPDTDLEINSDDILWVVGEQKMLESLFKEYG